MSTDRDDLTRDDARNAAPLAQTTLPERPDLKAPQLAVALVTADMRGAKRHLALCEAWFADVMAGHKPAAIVRAITDAIKARIGDDDAAGYRGAWGRHRQLVHWHTALTRDSAWRDTEQPPAGPVTVNGRDYGDPFDALRDSGATFLAVHRAFRTAIVRKPSKAKTADNASGDAPGDQPETVPGLTPFATRDDAMRFFADLTLPVTGEREFSLRDPGDFGLLFDYLNPVQTAAVAA